MKRLALTPLIAAVLLGGPALPLAAAPAPQQTPREARLADADDRDAALVSKLLRKEFEMLAKRSKHKTELAKAAELLKNTNQNSRWTDYKKAIDILRQSRSKAGVPLMMYYMIEHASFGSSNADEYVEAIELITGHRLGEVDDSGPDRVAKIQKRVDELFHEWWLPNQEKLITDVQDMSKEQLEVVCDTLYKKVDWQQGYSRDFRGDVTAYRIYHLLYYKTMKRGSSSSDRKAWFDGELDLTMVPLLLAKADYREKGIPEGKRPTVQRIPYAAVDLLAQLRKDGLAPQLDNVAEDPKQNSVTRLACVMAMYAAGEKLDTLAVLSILKTENRLEPRLNAIIALRHSSDAKAVTPVLLELLDDRNEEIQLAAVYGLGGAKPAKAVDKLKLMLDQAESAYAYSPILGLLGEIGTKEAVQVLADFMASALDDENKSRHLSQALRSFQDATGQRWTSAGARNKDYYKEKAREALAWWKKKRR